MKMETAIPTERRECNVCGYNSFSYEINTEFLAERSTLKYKQICKNCRQYSFVETKYVAKGFIIKKVADPKVEKQKKAQGRPVKTLEDRITEKEEESKRLEILAKANEARKETWREKLGKK